MALTFTRLSWWLWSGKDHDLTAAAPPAQSMSSSSDFGLGFRDMESLKFSVNSSRMRSSSRRVRRKWQSREERRIDREYDMVIVPSDGGCMSGSESDDSDWSIGWMEPHAPDFLSDGETEGSFAVLVPCYRRGSNEKQESTEHHLVAAVNSSDNYPPDGRKYTEDWLSSLQNVRF